MPVIEEYVKADGTVVRRHTRLPAGARRETAILGTIVAGVFIFGSGNTTATGTQQGQERLPQPQATTVYPIKWPGWAESAVRPTPTLSYPIVFPSSGSGR
ncbi:hypothetical protein ABZ924_33275 [Streptomyces sp. NPDC046876]|uniref:hypothetical protein n=1 Tax=Streptomyces sp. NPDC046876 TaxID=3155616 RepID=UPI0033F638AE